jgi:threonylcarbamoyladenosine tRNA methylthiotransferase CDKAL1
MDLMRIFVKTYGCSANSADSQAIMGCLVKSGYSLARSEGDAEIVIYNTCAVKGQTENRIVNDLKHIAADKKVIVAGCLPLISFDRLRREVRFDGIIGPAAAEMIPDIVKRVSAGEKVTELGKVEVAPKLELPRVRSNPVVSIVPVSSGCLGSCAYCCVVFARGCLRSCSVNEVVGLVKRDLAEGAKEFWVTAQDMGCYGRDLGTSLAKLLRALGQIEGDYEVRVGMMTPNSVKDDLDDLLGAFKSEKIFKFIHFPVQSGSNRVLGLMRRFYSVEDFENLVLRFREAFPKITLATDVICGFPGETAEEFEDTVRLLDRVKPDVVNVSKFFVRPGTAAAKMSNDFVDFREIKRRATTVAQQTKKISAENNEKWLGWVGEVLIDEKGKVPGAWVGRNFAYKPIAIKSKEELLGQKVIVKITSTLPTYLAGDICPIQ